MTRARYPYTLSENGDQVVVRLMTGADSAAILAFARNLAEDDLLVLRDDITLDAVVARWIDDLSSAQATTLLLAHKGKIVGYGTLHCNQLSWTRHLGEIHVMVSSAYRSRGYGRRLTRELLLLAQDLKLDKVVVYILAEQQGALRMFEQQGFKPEALLPDWVKTRDGRPRDLLIVSRVLDV